MKCHTNFLAKDVFSKFAFKSMIPDLDIFRSANLLLKQHGNDALSGRALLTHPALGQDITPSHTEGRSDGCS